MEQEQEGDDEAALAESVWGDVFAPDTAAEEPGRKGIEGGTRPQPMKRKRGAQAKAKGKAKAAEQ
eukprot:10352671-Alexandrium_andersonii.AAC.1